MSESLPGKDGNSRYLAAALSWIRLRLEHMANRDQVAAKSSGPAVKAIEQAARAMAEFEDLDPPPNALVLARLFQLSRFEQNVLLLCAGMELDTRIARLCARAQDDANCAFPTFALAMSLLLGGCGGMPSMPNIWPFADSGKERSRVPRGATVYACDNARTLYVRYVDDGKAAWVILPDREFRLNPVISASGARYSNGIGTLDTKGEEATLSDGATVTHANCKAAKAAAG